MSLSKKYFILILIILLGKFSFAGWSSNGGSSSLDKDNIWFLGDQPIPYCILSSQNSLPKLALHKIIQNSNIKWKIFFNKYEISSSESRTLADGSRKKMSLDLVTESHCADIEQFCGPSNTDIKKCEIALGDKLLFLFGKPNSIVKNYLDANGPAQGAAIRTEYNHQTQRSGGIIWINDFASSNWDSISHMTLHEMGHVFGMKHDSTWVMATDVTRFISGLSFTIGKLGEIEAPNWPYSLKQNDALYFTDKRYKNSNAPNGFYPIGYILPQNVIQLLRFSENNYFQLRANVSHANGLSAIVRFEFTEYPTGIVQTFESNLHPIIGGDEKKTPELYTQFSDRDGSKYYSTEFFEKGWVSSALNGVAEFNGEKIAVRLDRKRGLILSLYFSKSDQWINLATVQF